MYLSDGYILPIKKRPGLYAIKFFNDFKYLNDTNEWKNKLKLLLPNNSVNLHKHKQDNLWIIVAYNQILPILFPQYGPGAKHERNLLLENWQQNIILKYPKEFIKGCIQSDGSIYFSKANKYKHAYYNFNNKSKNIIQWFQMALNQIGIQKNITYYESGQIYKIQIYNKEDCSIMSNIIVKKS